MSRSAMRLTTFQRLLETGDLSSVILRLMMVCNDLTLADHSLAAWHKGQAGSYQGRVMGAKMYFVRLQIAHVFEGLSIIEDIAKAPVLSAAEAECDQQTRRSFEAVRSFIKSDDYQKMLRVRNNVAFHYDGKVAVKALIAAREEFPDMLLSMWMGEQPLDWHFEPADKIVDRVVVRDIFGVAKDADVRAEVDAIIVRLQDIGGKLVDFAGYFIQHHIQR